MTKLFFAFLLTASVAAGDWYPAGDCLDTGDVAAGFVLDVEIDSFFRLTDSLFFVRDTARYYAKVDTVLCRRIAGFKTWEDPYGDTVWTFYECFDTVGWLPKIQVWLDSTKYKKLMEWLDAEKLN